MSNALLPSALPGLAWGILKAPVWSTQVRNSASGRQFAVAKRAYPLWHFRLPYEVLRQSSSNPDLATLVGFINARRGRYDDFLYMDPRDKTAAGQVFGAGDGATRTFQLVRSFGGFVEPVGGVDTATAVITVNGVNTAVTYDANLSSVTFAAAPAAGAVLAWSGTYYFRCRFLQDEISFEQFLQDLWSAKSVEFQSFRP